MTEAKYQEIAGSGRLRVTTQKDVKKIVRDVAVVDGLLSPAMDTAVSSLYTGIGYSDSLSDRVWAANRCLQLNCQQLSSMPLRYYSPSSSPEPQWVSNPDPNWYPNGIGDAVFAGFSSMYGYGDAFLLVTQRYSNGYPSSWTVLDPLPMEVSVRRGKRKYRSGGIPLNEDDIVQISRDPKGGIQGTSALSSYASYLYGLTASAELARVMTGEGGVPNAILKTAKKLKPEQAVALQSQWAERTAVRRGLPAVLPPDVDFQQLSFSPQDLMLLEVQSFDARVIASAFSVPPFMINLSIEGGGMVYQNPETLFEVWWRTELRPAALRFSRALSSIMLPRGTFVEFDARAVLAPSFKELVDAWVALGEKGYVSSDEIRAAVLHLPPQEQGEALAALTVPPTASASPAQQPASVVALRPTQVVN